MEYLVDESHLFAIALVGVLAALQYTSVATLEAEGEDVERDVRPCFINHSYHAKWHADTFQTQAVWQYSLTKHTTEWRWQRGHIAHV